MKTFETAKSLPLSKLNFSAKILSLTSGYKEKKVDPQFAGHILLGSRTRTLTLKDL